MTPAVKQALNEGGLALFRLTYASADAFPPLKSVAGGALHIIDLVAVSKYLNTCRSTLWLIERHRNSNPIRKTGSPLASTSNTFSPVSSWIFLTILRPEAI